MRHSTFAGLLLLSSLMKANACPPPGHYELYNADGVRTGHIKSTTTISGAPTNTTQVECKTEMEIPGVTTNYQYTETDKAEIGKEGIRSFRRESDENGKKAIYLGELRGKNLVINYERDGQKYSIDIATSSFDLSEFETELPTSKFRQLKSGESKTLRVFFLDRLAVISVSRNVSPVRDFPYNETKVPVVVVTTLIKGKPTTSWYDNKTGNLLQEEGTNYLMSRVENSSTRN